MDIDELDRWLDADDEGEGAQQATSGGYTHTAFEDDPPVVRGGSPAAEGGRPRWLLPLAAGGVIWAAVLVVVLLGRGGGDGAAATATDPSVLPVEGVPGVAGDGSAMTDPLADPLAGGGPPADPFGATESAGDPGTGPVEVRAGGDGEPDRPIDPEVATAAVAALRARLTAAGDDGTPTRYLEMAAAVGLQDLGEDTGLVLLDAVWLEGRGGQLDRAVRGRWAVPVAGDGTVLSPPWPVPGGPPDPLQPDPPVGALRLPEVETALEAVGWTGVAARAADPHPLLVDVVVALVDGTAPDGGAHEGTVLWLQDGDAGLALLGVQP